MKSIAVRRMSSFPIVATALAAALLAAGCSRGSSDEEQAEVNATQSEVNVPIPTEPAAPAIVDAPGNSAEPAVTLNEIISEEAQMQEDAEATGMTSRLPAGTGQEEPAGNAPVAE